MAITMWADVTFNDCCSQSEPSEITETCVVCLSFFSHPFCLSCQHFEEPPDTSLGFHHAGGDYGTDFSLANLPGWWQWCRQPLRQTEEQSFCIFTFGATHISAAALSKQAAAKSPLEDGFKQRETREVFFTRGFAIRIHILTYQNRSPIQHNSDDLSLSQVSVSCILSVDPRPPPALKNKLKQ